MGDKDTKSDFNLEKFNKKLLNAKSSKNLLKAGDILNSCNDTLNKQHPNFNPDLKSQVKALIEANKETIKKTTDEFIGEIAKVEDSFKSRDFTKIPTKLKNIKSQVKESGITEILNNIKFLEKKTDSSIEAQRNLEKYEIPVPLNIQPDELELKYYSLNKLLKDTQKEQVVHPEIISKMEEVYNIYQNSMKEHGLSDSKKSLGKNLKLMKESRNISKINKKFDNHLSDAKNTLDLLKAKEFLGLADDILKGIDSKLIYQDKQTEYQIFLKKIDSLIEKWTNDTESIIKNSKDMMEKFNFSEAKKTLVNLNEDLKKNGLENLIESVNINIYLCDVNEQIYNEMQEINGVYESKTYFKAHKKLESLKQMISTKFSSVEMLKSNKEQINSLIDNISKARNKEEVELKEEVEKIWKNLTESLDFDANKKDLDAKRNFADQNEYPSIISIIDNYLSKFDLNLQIFNFYNDLTQSLKEAKFNHVKVELGKISTKISGKPEVYFLKIKENYTELEKETNNQISNEKTKIIQKLDNIEAIIDEKNDLSKSLNIIDEIKKRIYETDLIEFSSLLLPIVQKIELNKAAVNIQKEIIKKIAENQLNIGKIEYTKLLEKFNSALEETPKIYSSALKLNLENEFDNLKAKISDMSSKLTEEFNKLEEPIKKTYDFSQVQTHLKNYKDRANKLGMDELIKEIDDLDQDCSKNTKFVLEYNQLNKNYESLIDFVPTVGAIYKLYDSSEKEEKIFDHVKANIQKLHERAKSEGSKRESKVKNAYEKIIKTEIKALKFSKAIASLTENLETAQNLNVTSIVPEIKQHINFCSINLPILENFDRLEVELNSGKIIEARKNIASIKPQLPPLGKQFEDITKLIISRWENLNKSIENEIELQIEKLKGEMPGIVALVEDKKTNKAKSSLLTALNRAQYLGVGMTVAEINDLLKICDMQSSSTPVSKKKQKVKKIEPQIKKPAPIERTRIMNSAKSEPVKSEFSPRSSLRRTSKNPVQVCTYCKASQPSDHEKFCFFCGKQL